MGAVQNGMRRRRFRERMTVCLSCHILWHIRRATDCCARVCPIAVISALHCRCLSYHFVLGPYKTPMRPYIAPWEEFCKGAVQNGMRRRLSDRATRAQQLRVGCATAYGTPGTLLQRLRLPDLLDQRVILGKLSCRQCENPIRFHRVRFRERMTVCLSCHILSHQARYCCARVCPIAVISALHCRCLSYHFVLGPYKTPMRPYIAPWANSLRFRSLPAQGASALFMPTRLHDRRDQRISKPQHHKLSAPNPCDWTPRALYFCDIPALQFKDVGLSS
jgi:hypothetical protein